MWTIILTIKYFLTIAFLLCFLKAEPQNNYLSGSRQSALSGCGVTLHDLWSVSHNQAGLGFINNFAAGIYSERKYLLKELSFNSIAAIVPAGKGSFGLNMSYYGFSKYHEIKTGLAYGHKLGEKISAGLQLDYFNSYIYGAPGNHQKITFECGLLSYPLENLALAVHLFNPFPGKSQTNSSSDLSSVFRLGTSYSMYDKLLVMGEFQKEFSDKGFFKGGIEFLPVKQLALRFGISTGVNSYSFGAGYLYKKIIAGISFVNHQILGLTPGFEVAIAL